MNPTQLRVVGAGLFYVAIFVSGGWLCRSGKPYSTGQLTMHKLVSLAALAYLALVVFRVDQVGGVGPIGWLAVAITAVPFLVTIATGGLLSTDRAMPGVVAILHQITPYLTIVCTALTIQFLLGCIL